jgi:peptidoglycan/LPS O-acetylase OafA/YrhL
VHGTIYRWTIVEVVTVLIIFTFISAAGAGPLSLAAPLAFAVIVIVFAHEAGACSKILSWRPFAFLGLISYSIYMVHMLILSWWLATARVVIYKIGGENLFLEVIALFEAYIFMEGRNYTGLALMLLVVVAMATVTYILIEKPARDWSRRSTLFTSTPSKAREE